MSDVKIRPPAGPTQGAATGPERAAQKPDRAFELDESATSTSAVSGATEPAALVQELRAGSIDIDQAVEILVEQTLKAQPLAAASETMQREIRQALVELVRDDPTLSALAASMKR